MKKFIKENQEMLIIGFVSLIAFILGCMAIGWLWSLLIIGFFDALFLIPRFLKGKRKTKVRNIESKPKKNKSETKPQVKKEEKR